MVADSAVCDLSAAHSRKVEYYNTEHILDYVRQRTGYTPIIFTITVSWRGILAVPTVNIWSQLGLPKRDLMVLVARALEGSGRIWTKFTNTNGGPRHHPGWGLAGPSTVI